MQTSAKKACFQFAECSFSSAKKMQTSAKKACFQFVECSFSYAKRRLFLVTSKDLEKKYLGGKRRKRKYAALGIENRILDSILIPIVNCLFDGERLLRKSL